MNNKADSKLLPKLTTLLPPFCAFMIDDEMTCGICLEDNDGNIEVDGCIQGRGKRRLITSCGHIFHKKCLQLWTSASLKGSLCGVITCPSCRGEVYADEESTETKKKYFNELANCNCCPRHQRDRPASYAYDPELDNRRISKAQEEALKNLPDDTNPEYIKWCNSKSQNTAYFEWCKANSIRRKNEQQQCDCECRRGMRIMVRRIPPPMINSFSLSN
jgi:hypothetical protein